MILLHVRSDSILLPTIEPSMDFTGVYLVCLLVSLRSPS